MLAPAFFSRLLSFDSVEMPLSSNGRSRESHILAVEEMNNTLISKNEDWIEQPFGFKESILKPEYSYKRFLNLSHSLPGIKWLRVSISSTINQISSST